MALASLAITFLAHTGRPPTDFAAEVEAANAIYAAVLASSAALVDDGRIAEATKALLDLVPENERRAAHWFLLGNFFFQQDFALSYALHEKAFELAPDESMTQYEWALERHRKGEYAEADALYARLVAASDDGSDPRIHAFRADCLLHVGKLFEAVAAWKAADPRRRHSSIEGGFSWIYGAPQPIVERARLLGLARSGNRAAVEELILLDLAWQEDWWNMRPHPAYLEVDLALAAATLGANTPRYRQLALLVELTPEVGAAGAIGAGPDYVQRLRQKRVAGADVALAENSRVAGRLLDLVESAGAATAAELLGWYERPLRARVDAAPGDEHALEILAAFYEKDQREAELAAIEEIGWKKFGAVACVTGILARRGAALTSGDDLLKAALAKYPDDQHLRGLAIDCAMREKKGEREAVVLYLEAHLAHLVSWNDGAQRGFAALEMLTAK